MAAAGRIYLDLAPLPTPCKNAHASWDIAVLLQLCHSHCHHQVNSASCNPRRGRLLVAEMPIGRLVPILAGSLFYVTVTFSFLLVYDTSKKKVVFPPLKLKA